MVWQCQDLNCLVFLAFYQCGIFTMSIPTYDKHVFLEINKVTLFLQQVVRRYILGSVVDSEKNYVDALKRILEVPQ